MTERNIWGQTAFFLGKRLWFVPTVRDCCATYEDGFRDPLCGETPFRIKCVLAQAIGPNFRFVQRANVSSLAKFGSLHYRLF